MAGFESGCVTAGGITVTQPVAKEERDEECGRQVHGFAFRLCPELCPRGAKPPCEPYGQFMVKTAQAPANSSSNPGLEVWEAVVFPDTVWRSESRSSQASRARTRQRHGTRAGNASGRPRLLRDAERAQGRAVPQVARRRPRPQSAPAAGEPHRIQRFRRAHRR